MAPFPVAAGGGPGATVVAVATVPPGAAVPTDATLVVAVGLSDGGGREPPASVGDVAPAVDPGPVVALAPAVGGVGGVVAVLAWVAVFPEHPKATAPRTVT